MLRLIPAWRPLLLALCAIPVQVVGWAHAEDTQAPSTPGAAESRPGRAQDDAARRLRMHYYFKGRHIYEGQCVPCHGERGRGDGPWAEGLRHKPRNFRTGVFKFRSTPYGKLPTDDDLRRTIRRGISGTAMPMFTKLSDADVQGLIVYIQSFSRRWNDDKNRAVPVELPETPEWFRNAAALRKNAKRGSTTFATHCATCHGAAGDGDGPGARGLVDVWGNPIVPAALSDEHHKSGDDPGDLYRSIATGLDGTPMIGFAEILEERQIWELVAWIKTQEKTGQREEKSGRDGDR